MSRSRLTALAAAAVLVLSGCGMADELSGPSPVSRPSTSAPSSDGAPGDLLPTDTGPESSESEPSEPEPNEPEQPEPTEPEPTEPTEPQPSTSDRELGAPGIPACDVLDLPATTLEVIEDIEAGGPYDYPRNDGVRFQNREGILPDEDHDYYREFTVETPGLDHRGARRIVTGGFEETDPEHWYFTGDHYESFCEFDPDLRDP
ncbi:hypothetical protein MWU75_08405 [Ornithinimicrobium sp. F0845]|uniref:ribonuclease domain-containing protein n=1 Tax=Ornithinimicrobium sp. F0845 TaxID=2926412 RepID=UPI001FF49BFB|nr:ribonuclease domain-containing protein [Ornithinimicrobium sp. F0845]MCK0112155.1 hypothetical protein [Ornithinimicrobium sp. F0845]